MKKPNSTTPIKTLKTSSVPQLSQKPKVLVIVGPTASGKTDLAIELALKLNGEVISADSRQVYRGLDIGSGKVTPMEARGIPHHLIDIADPANLYSVEQFKHDAMKAIEDVIKRGKLPIICGGTGFYVESVIKNIVRPKVATNKKLRDELAKHSLKELQEKLKSLDPLYANKIDMQNPVRIIRAIEIATELGSVPELIELPLQYDFFQIGIDSEDSLLKKRIEKRLENRFEQGMTEEVVALMKTLSFERLFELGLEYRYISLFLKGELTESDVKKKLALEIWHYAKRQRTWFKRDKTIHWIKNVETEKAFDLAQKFLTN